MRGEKGTIAKSNRGGELGRKSKYTSKFVNQKGAFGKQGVRGRS